MYEPREDSFFLESHLKKLDEKFEIALDMGTGSGILAKALLEKAYKVIAVDINPDVIKRLDERFEKYESDLFKKVPNKYYKSIDLIVFNPPYLPLGEDEQDDTLHGGELGVETTIKFLAQSKKYLKHSGKILFIASSTASLAILDLKIKELGYKAKIKDTLKLFFEQLHIYEVTYD